MHWSQMGERLLVPNRTVIVPLLEHVATSQAAALSYLCAWTHTGRPPIHRVKRTSSCAPPTNDQQCPHLASFHFHRLF